MTWTMIRDLLAQEIADGTLEPGDRLPTEPELVARFGAGRHSVRRAVEALAKEGKLSVEQGRGTFVEEAPSLIYSIGKRTRLRRNLLPQGYDVSSVLLGADRVVAPPPVCKALGLSDGAEVVESRRKTIANGIPIAFGSNFHDAQRFPDIVERRDVLGSMTETYKSYGIDDYVRAETSMHARQARAEEAKQLKQHPDMPVIVVRAVDRQLDGQPLASSQVIWSSARVRFTMSMEDDD
ncbi:phosphonate metabolism transcriptional regulator PhnF [Actibacterium mucosum]|nr:phosphonate metabolism transcriptional regulator PhnF [Actibacterium mucosum]